jgi:ferritin-like metal-binding protein YciE
MKIEILEDLYLTQILRLYDAEKLQQSTLEKFAVAASSNDLAKLLQEHFEETKSQMDRLEEIIADFRNEEARVDSKAMRAIIAEADDLIGCGLEPDLLDAALIACIMTAESHEISCYASALGLAKLLGFKQEGGLLARSLQEEKAMDDRLFALGQTLGQEMAEGEEVLKPRLAPNR